MTTYYEHNPFRPPRQLSLIPDEVDMQKVQKHMTEGEALKRDKDIRAFIATSGGHASNTEAP